MTREERSADSAFDDPEVARLLREYEAGLAAGRTPDRAALLAQRPELADELNACLDGLEFVHAAAPQLRGDAAPQGRAPASLGDFRIVREIARGGMGVVYEAEQVSLGRRVAVKVLPKSATADPRRLVRFHNEAEAAAQLHHSRIVPVYAVGYSKTTVLTAVIAAASPDGERQFVKLEQSPFYAAGGGQVSDRGTITVEG